MMRNSFIQKTLAEYLSCTRHREDLKDLFALDPLQVRVGKTLRKPWGWGWGEGHGERRRGNQRPAMQRMERKGSK